ncbi:MAG: DHHW family protein [Bacillota bacterium]
MQKNNNDLNNIYISENQGGKTAKKSAFKINAKSVVAIILSVFIVVIGVASVILPDKTFSENENRYLPSLPQFSLDALFSGDYIADVEQYLQDHFPGRDFFVAGKADVEIALGKDQNNGIYLGKDGYLISQFTAASQADLDKKIASINSFIAKLEGVEVNFALAPSSNLVNGDKLPDNRPDDDIQGVLDYINGQVNGNITNLSGTLSEINKVQQLYFKTDHHWNTYGAYYAYAEIMKSMGETPIPITQYQKVVLSEEFKGTMFSQGGFFNMAGEEFALLENINKSELIVNYILTGGETNTLYSDKYLTEKDKYSYFLDGNHPIITVENQNAPIDKHIVIVKDSYANIMVPFLADSYSKITIIDLRFYAGSVSEYVEAEGVDDVIILYNIDGFQTDLGIYKLR